MKYNSDNIYELRTFIQHMLRSKYRSLPVEDRDDVEFEVYRYIIKKNKTVNMAYVARLVKSRALNKIKKNNYTEGGVSELHIDERTTYYTAILEELSSALNKRDRAILTMLDDDMTQEQIADRLFISQPAVSYCVSRLKEKISSLLDL